MIAKNIVFKVAHKCYINRIQEHPFNGYLVFKTTTNNNKHDLTHIYCVHNNKIVVNIGIQRFFNWEVKMLKNNIITGGTFHVDQWK